MKLGLSKKNQLVIDKISRHFGSPVSIVKDYFGKASILHGEKLYPYSYSKTNGYQLFSFSLQSDIEIGVDIEFIRDRNFNFKKKFMSDQECYFYENLNNDEKKKLFFYQIFSMKEAIFKAKGDGLLSDLSSICLLNKMAGLDISISFEIDIYGMRYLLHQDLCDNYYVVSLAVIVPKLL